MNSSRPCGFFGLALLTFSACAPIDETTSGEPSAHSTYVVPDSLEALSETTFFDHPWPSDLRKEQGSVRLAGYPNPRKSALLAQYVDAMSGVLDGFSPVAAGFARFSAPLDATTLPASPLEALSPTSSVQLIDIDPASPDHGKRQLINLSFRAEEGVYIRDNTLAYMPTVGFPLRPHTRYAFVVTDSIRTSDGQPVAPSDDLKQVLGLVPTTRDATRAAKEASADSLAELSAAGIDPKHIVQLALFTTNDPTEETFAARDVIEAEVAPPTIHPDGLSLLASNAALDEYVGVYGPSPNFQEGKLPFAKYGDGGAFKMEAGRPTPYNSFDLRFSLTVPNQARCPMPVDGYPIILYAHGTGGDYRTYVSNGMARALAQKCMATMGVDQIFHGTRPGADAGNVEILFFNFQNVVAARHNTRQSALDEVQRARLFTKSHVTIPASVSATAADIHFDASKLMFLGHSQGGLNGPLYLAADDSARGAVLSGSSSVMSITLLEKTEPKPDVSALVKRLLFALGDEEQGEVDIFHPEISLIQTLVDVVDPINYARYENLAPRAGFAAKSTYMTEGINPDGLGDSYAPPHGIEAQALAMGLPLSLPAQRPIAESAWGGPQPVTVPPEGLSGNLANGQASGVLAQWAVPDGEDGHFVMFDVPAARAQAVQFLRNLADDPRGRVPAP